TGRRLEHSPQKPAKTVRERDLARSQNPQAKEERSAWTGGFGGIAACPLGPPTSRRHFFCAEDVSLGDYPFSGAFVGWELFIFSRGWSTRRRRSQGDSPGTMPTLFSKRGYAAVNSYGAHHLV